MLKKTIRIEEAADQCKVDVHVITQWIAKEWIVLAQPGENALDDEDLARMRLIVNLTEDFGVNEEGIFIILHLLDQLYHIQNRVSSSQKI